MAGRPSKYKPEVVEIICDSLRKGEPIVTACKKAGISDDTYGNWLREYSEFSVAVKNAEQEYRDWEHNEILASAKKSLRVLIEGTEYEETKTEYEQDPSDPKKPRIKRQTTTTKKILPNVTAVIFALTNRDPENWKNRQTLEGKVDTGEKAVDLQLSKIPDDLLDKLVEALRK